MAAKQTVSPGAQIPLPPFAQAIADWAVHRHLWRGQAVYLRSLFDANKNISEPRHQRLLFQEAEALLEKWKHPDPYRPPTAPGGSKFERNLPVPNVDPPPHMLL